ncbi:MAG: hypothetical protein A3A44_01365 [Candidatus Sungbacteria bacterium RIFCSPLOWO2_01_FULL_60_25]|uniref:Type II secretion system protein GspG C-terminal domain-containing protein n=1 Tax=Candidatus Sungbacteria bacterium RIFCSPLOWO2_01_FULL_60_25 TaxID=1802281 RepID=A0A1G2LDK5_9BACT|nr:MAG: hypothetical protein A3A44_01365 [Candidatus Sungbacteria bacterium RIFCSPLOWO2_01_FULL_60_25]
MFLRRNLRPAQDQRGFTLVDVMIAVAIISILAAIVVPLYGNVTARIRVIEARNNARIIATAVVAYSRRTGNLPAALADLAVPVVVNGACAGPFLDPIPTPPKGGDWPAAYTYTVTGQTFVVFASGDGATITMP